MKSRSLPTVVVWTVFFAFASAIIAVAVVEGRTPRSPATLFGLQRRSTHSKNVAASQAIDATAMSIWTAQSAIGAVQPKDDGYADRLRKYNALSADWENQRAALAALWAQDGRVVASSLRFDYMRTGDGAIHERAESLRDVIAPTGVVVSVDDLRSGWTPSEEFADMPSVFLFHGRALAVVAHYVPRRVQLRFTTTQDAVRRCAGGGYYWGTEFHGPTDSWDLTVTAMVPPNTPNSHPLAVAVHAGSVWSPVPCVQNGPEWRCHERFVDVRTVIIVRIALPYEGCPSIDQIH